MTESCHVDTDAEGSPVPRDSDGALPAARGDTRVGRRFAASVGLTSASWQILGAVEADPATVAHVARGLGLTRQAVQETADRMAREGLVRFLENPDHKRSRLMTPTDKARKALDYLRPRQVQFANLMGAPHSLEQLQATLTVLQRSRTTIETSAREPMHDLESSEPDRHRPHRDERVPGEVPRIAARRRESGMQMLRDDGGMVLTLIKARHEDNADVGLDEGHEGEPTREGRKGRVRYPSSFHIGFIQPSPARCGRNQPAAARRRLRRRCPGAAARVVDVLFPGAWRIHDRGVGLGCRRRHGWCPVCHEASKAVASGSTMVGYAATRELFTYRSAC